MLRWLRNRWRRWRYETQCSPEIYSKVLGLLDENPHVGCPFCEQRGHHRSDCYLVSKSFEPLVRRDE